MKNEILLCQYFIERKKRTCGMMRKKNMKYCVEHSKLDPQEAKENLKKRIPCPLDPNHTIYEYQLNKHVKKCNKNKLIHSNDNQCYYLQDLNLGNKENRFNKKDISLEREHELIIATIPILKAYLDQNLHPNCNGVWKLDKRENQFMIDNRYVQLENEKTRKHAIQQSSLIQNMLDRGILQSENLLSFGLIEFGCGRAEFTRYIHDSLVNNKPPSGKQHCILIDRAPNRNKFDSKLIHMQKDRLRIDIKDLKVNPLLHDNLPYTSVSKHLCGVATDLTLRCLLVNNNSVNPNGICIAMCCRHICNPDDYINPDFIIEKVLSLQKDEQRKLSYNELFFALTKIVSWATSGKRNNEDETTHFTDLGYEEREEIGLIARGIIDYGRFLFVKSILDNTHNVELIRYVEKSVSLENTALLVSKK
ncbi:hypothetical protein TBLA_0B08620 [Henningerozyma blattae CBS 6284]|uniref:tRNA:m(4)X modification enzyme TRM13 n=1 Tax=Henningerozyma blattae (strain ATCC 34711 / CBS 6284 / DSM 70876 / NBRC 10599 / NRRL Y-10934 / UCD 77-7) TaxID=1071380 RepID=I2GZX5_HENB6|nr:hypothetical protein TBLA_0B08620 [Tetrapisispora blattae CBS 6284]CCH59677.1 hypothetical protein TBLA_0B08620 [Tetrapisispora blattae CBS 6284]